MDNQTIALELTRLYCQQTIKIDIGDEQSVVAASVAYKETNDKIYEILKKNTPPKRARIGDIKKLGL